MSRSPRCGSSAPSTSAPTATSRCGVRLPTPQCAPNFAFLMAADARATIRRLPEVRDVSVVLEDHYTGDEINAALARGEGFSGAFPGETADDELASPARAVQAQGAGRAPGGRVRVAPAKRAYPRPTCSRIGSRDLRTGRRRGAASRCAGISGSRMGRTRRVRLADGGPLAPGELGAVAADGAARADEPRGKRGHLPLAPGVPSRLGEPTEEVAR